STVAFFSPDGSRTDATDKRLRPNVPLGLVFDGDELAEVHLPPVSKTASKGFAYIRSTLTARERQAGLKPLPPGDRVVCSGAVELKAALEEVQARARREQEEKEKASREKGR